MATSRNASTTWIWVETGQRHRLLRLRVQGEEGDQVGHRVGDVPEGAPPLKMAVKMPVSTTSSSSPSATQSMGVVTTRARGMDRRRHISTPMPKRANSASPKAVISRT